MLREVKAKSRAAIDALALTRPHLSLVTVIALRIMHLATTIQGLTTCIIEQKKPSNADTAGVPDWLPVESLNGLESPRPGASSTD